MLSNEELQCNTQLRFSVDQEEELFPTQGSTFLYGQMIELVFDQTHLSTPNLESRLFFTMSLIIRFSPD